MMNIIFLSVTAFAQVRSNLFTKPEVKVTKSEESSRNRKGEKPKPVSEPGNLPVEYLHRGAFSAAENPLVYPTTKSSQLNWKAQIGTLLSAEVRESVFAFAESKAPVRVIVTSGDLKGAIILGEASLEKNSKRILISLKSMRVPNSREQWALAASVLDLKGVVGVEGKLVSSESKYFAGEFLSGAAAGYADSTVEREQNSIGNYVERPGVGTFTKKALAAALSKTSDRFAEKLKAIPEYSILEGPFPVQVLVTEQPKLTE